MAITPRPALLVVASLLGAACAGAPDVETDDPCAPRRTAIYQPPVTLGGSGQVQVIEAPSDCAVPSTSEGSATAG